MKRRRALAMTLSVVTGLSGIFAANQAVAGHKGQTYHYNGSAGYWTGSYAACNYNYAPQPAYYASQHPSYAPATNYATPQRIVYAPAQQAWQPLMYRR